VLAKALPEDGVILSLKKGEYDQALADVTPRLEKPQENLALRLYERGLVQFHMGVAKGDAGLVADAGLSFMRVVIYFGRAGAVSPFYGPALVGAGQVFEQLGRRELAIALYRQSRDVLTSDDDSALAALRDERLKALEAGTEKPPTP
jgi:tetratricopeptide (TPR) repeat protein